MSRRNSGRKGKRKWIKFPLVKKIKSIIMILVLLVIVFSFGPKLISMMIQNLSPWAEQRKAIERKNNIEDSYSAIIGSKVTEIPKTDLMKFISSQSSKEVDISIPKIANYSPLFNDELETDILKTGFYNSINEEIMAQFTKTVLITYDGSTIVKLNKNKKEKQFTSEQQKLQNKVTDTIKMFLHNKKKIEFKEWETVDSVENVEYKLNSNKNTVKVVGQFKDDGTLWLSSTYTLSAELKLVGNKWEVVPDKFEVKEL